jgi:glycosyltransferase involved in cell wall biosynthesis
VPAFNAERFIAGCLESALQQTIQDFEIIVVNDGSTDGTEDLVLATSQRHPGKIRYFKQRNRGPATARNFGAAHARGRYLAFLDADDVWLPRKLEVLLDVFEKNPEAGFCYSDAYAISADGKYGKTLMQYNRPASGWILPDLLQHNFIPLSTGVVKRRCFNEVDGFIDGITHAEDYQLWLKLARSWPARYVSEPLIGYRRHEAGLSRNVELMRKSAISLLTQFSTEFPEVRRRYSRSLREGIANNHYLLGFYYYKTNSFAKAAGSFARSIFYNPGKLPAWKGLAILALIPWGLLRRRNARVPRIEGGWQPAETAGI